MAYRLRQYGLGFDLERPDWSALRFEALARRRGKEITVIIRTDTGRDRYGNPVESEIEYTTKGFLRCETRSVSRLIGDEQESDLTVYLPVWAAAEKGWGLEIEGDAFVITSVWRSQTFAKLLAKGVTL